MAVKKPAAKKAVTKKPALVPVKKKTGANLGKADLVDIIAAETGATKSAGEQALRAVLSAITAAAKKGGKTTLLGFGTFKLSKRAARTARNPKTGAAIKIAASKSLSFKAAKALKAAL